MVFESYWLEMRRKVVELRELLQRTDDGNRLVWGSESHQFGIWESASEEEIRTFEKNRNTRLPENYRTYLQYFGAGGVGPELGINRFPDVVWSGDLSKPLNLDFYPDLDFTNGYAETEYERGPLFDLDGMLRIGNAGQAQNYLIVSGDLLGNVLCWDRWGGLGWLSGPFDIWYGRWLECIYLGLNEHKALKTLRDGMHLSEVLSIPGLNIKYRHDNDNVVRFEYNRSWVELDSNKKVCRISHRDYPIGQSGFRCWSENRSKYLG